VAVCSIDLAAAWHVYLYLCRPLDSTVGGSASSDR